MLDEFSFPLAINLTFTNANFTDCEACAPPLVLARSAPVLMPA
jgi:hypothetical protein